MCDLSEIDGQELCVTFDSTLTFDLYYREITMST